MKALVVHADPAGGPLHRDLVAAAERGLTVAGHDVTTVDLVAIGFRSAMSTEERIAYHSPDPIRCPQVAEHAQLVRTSQILVFVYPTIVGGVPAVMKGWLDRVMLDGVAFTIDPSSHRPVPLLRHVRRLVGVTTVPTTRARTFVLSDAGRRTINRTLRLVCARTVRTRWMALYDAPASSAEERDAFVAKVERGLAGRARKVPVTQ
jgi:NAD(P)H dehydrogenase (quinone)